MRKRTVDERRNIGSRGERLSSGREEDQGMKGGTTDERRNNE
jgi:hypothetical protein